MAAYKSRDNKTILNDDNAAWLTRSFAQMFRILKNDACAVSFYGWPKVDLFFAAWKSAGFRIGGHIIFRKRYASKTAFVQFCIARTRWWERKSLCFQFIVVFPSWTSTRL